MWITDASHADCEDNDARDALDALHDIFQISALRAICSARGLTYVEGTGLYNADPGVLHGDGSGGELKDAGGFGV